MIDDDFSNESASITTTFLHSIQDWNLVSHHSIDSRSEKTERTLHLLDAMLTVLGECSRAIGIIQKERDLILR